MAIYESDGNPLTGALNGTDGDDTYIGRYLGDSPNRPAIQEVKLTDLSGASIIQALNVLAAGWSPEGITRSTIRLGDGNQSIEVEVLGNGSIRGIADTSIEMGAGPSVTEISVNTGTSNDNRDQTGMESSSFKAGAGTDLLKITVNDNTTPPDARENLLRGITGSINGSGIDMGDGDDQVSVDVSNLNGKNAIGLSGTALALGSGNDELFINTTQIGAENSTVEGGSGNDRITLDSYLVSLKSSLLNLGDGNDLVTLVEAGVNSVSMDAATVSLGAGDDRLNIVRGTGTVDGGTGTDTMQLKGASANFLFKPSGLSKLLIQDVTDGRTNLTVSNIEQFQFDDKTLTASEALAQLGQTALPTSSSTTTRHSGEPLTGYINGSAGIDIYEGNSTRLSSASITGTYITDSLGNSRVQALAIDGGWNQTGILNSIFKLGDGIHELQVNAIGQSTRGIAGTHIEMGAGPSVTEISVNTGTSNDNRDQTGMESSSFKAGAGTDLLKITVNDNTTPPDARENLLRGITGSINGSGIDMGDGDDQVSVDVSNLNGKNAIGLSGTALALGSGNDELFINTTQIGAENSTVEGGSGNDRITLDSYLVSLKSSLLNLGDGNDLVTLVEAGVNSVSMDAATVSLGAGDDRLNIVRGTGTVDGGTGTDTMQLKGASANFLFKPSGLSKLLIQDVTDGRTNLTVSNIEQFQFDDKTLTASEALAQLGQTALPTSSSTTTRHSGEPLTGYINGSAGIDIYEGWSTALNAAAISRAFVTDSLGDSQIRVLSDINSWSLTGILNSSFKLGDGMHTLEIIGSGYTHGIAGSSIELGAGGSRTEINLTNDTQDQNGMEGSSISAGPGDDVLKVSVTNNKPGSEAGNAAVRGGGINMGDGEDQVSIDAVASDGSLAIGMVGAALSLGSGNDNLVVNSTLIGLHLTTIEGGAGNDIIDITAVESNLSASHLNTGAGNDTVSLKIFTASSASMSESTINLGDGDDQLELSNGSGSIDGGLGTDRIVFSAPSSVFTYSQIGTDKYLVKSIADESTKLNLTNIEVLQFQDKTITLKEVIVLPPSYQVSASTASVDESGTVTFNLSTQNLTAGSVVPYTLSGAGITSGDVDGGLLSGTLKTDASGKASLAVKLLADSQTEGNETLIFSAGDQSTSVSIKDTSTAATAAAAGVLFTEATNLNTSEAGGKAQFKVALATAPRYDVVLTLTNNDTTEGLFISTAANGTQLTSATRVLTFTASNWNQPQTVSLIGVDDSETDGDVAFVITSKVSSSDLNYDGMRAGQGLAVANLIATNLDDDKPEEIYGTKSNDVLVGGPGPSDIYGDYGRDEMYGGKGNDRMYGDYGDDVLYGEDGNDSLEGEQGSDKLYGGSGKDSLTGGSGNDSLFGGDGEDVLDGQDGADSMDGGKGADTYYVDNPADVVTDSGDDGALDTVYIASYLGSTYVMGKGIVNGTLSAQAGPGGLSGNASDNKLEGNTQNNTLSGGLGSDTLAGGGGNDSVDGGDGTDTVVLSGNESDSNITIDANKLLTVLTSKFGNEVTTVSSVEFVQFKDTLKSILSTVKGDTIAPTLSARSPAANATNVSSGANLTLTFSEQVQAGSGSVVLKRAGTVDRSINVSDINQVIFAGNTVVINPSEELAAATSYSVELASGVIQDLSGNAYSGLSGYSFTTQAAGSGVPVANQFVGLSNVKLVKDVAGNKSTVTFSVTFNSDSIDGQKVNGTLLDLDYDHSKVTSARVSGAQYESDGEATPVWQFITPNLQGVSANGKIVALANTDPANPILVGGKTLDITLALNQALDSFKIGFNKQSASVVTADGIDRTVGTAADVTAVPNTSYTLKASTVHWKSLAAGTAKVLPDVSFVKGSQTLKSSSAGQAVFEASSDSQASVVVGKSVAESEKAAAAAAVNLTDAIAILKMIVGLPVNAVGTATSPYQVVAADFNRDGGVGLTDAIDVLKAVVGLNAPAPSWVVLDQSKVSSSMTMDSYNADKAKSNGWMSSTLSVDLDKTPEIQLVGVLAGDVDGSWAG